MLIAFELSGEHNTIPISEVSACLRLLEADFQVCHSLDGCLIIDLGTGAGKIVENISKRLAMTHHITKVLGIGGSSEQEILDLVGKNMPDFEGTYSVRVKRVREHSTINTESMERQIGSIFYRKGKRANLKSPQMQFRVVLTEDKSIFASLLYSIDRSIFEARKPHFKPFFYPGVLMPRVARALVNISMPQGSLLDPFCGTGGILVEAGLIGIKVIGADMQRKILLGAKMNLEHYNVNYTLMYEDACRLALRDESVDAVVTDPPYGRSAAIKADSLEYMLAMSMKEIYRVLKNGKRAVFVSERPIEAIAKDAGFEVVETHLQRVHKSLTRRILVLEKHKLLHKSSKIMD
ncbi:MAG: TRM11 family methyltransferase [Candidatus Methanoperedens sp.]|nr:TRM11 family methyltransferase [Candidatus Methanoperedens sp.]CAG0957095.1 tRNA (guanine(6)-N2)-methyltransferase [Methanosarcinales archaeon]